MAVQNIEMVFSIRFETKEEWLDFVDSFNNFTKEKYFELKKNEELNKILQEKVKNANDIANFHSKRAYPKAEYFLQELEDLELNTKQRIEKLDETVTKKYKREYEILSCFEMDTCEKEINDHEHLSLDFHFCYENEVQITPFYPATMTEPAEGGDIEDMMEESEIENYFYIMTKAIGFGDAIFDLDIEYSDLDDEMSICERELNSGYDDRYDF